MYVKSEKVHLLEPGDVKASSGRCEQSVGYREFLGRRFHPRPENLPRKRPFFHGFLTRLGCRRPTGFFMLFHKATVFSTRC